MGTKGLGAATRWYECQHHINLLELKIPKNMLHEALEGMSKNDQVESCFTD